MTRRSTELQCPCNLALNLPPCGSLYTQVLLWLSGLDSSFSGRATSQASALSSRKQDSEVHVCERTDSDTSVFFSVLIVVSVFGIIAAPIMAITKAISVSPEFFSMIDSKPVSYEGASEPDISPHEDIELKGVCFSYPTRPNVQVLKCFDARFLKGKTTALVGPSGSGKSTIVALLERWYELDPSEAEEIPGDIATAESDREQYTLQRTRGTIRVGGVDNKPTNLNGW